MRASSGKKDSFRTIVNLLKAVVFLLLVNIPCLIWMNHNYIHPMNHPMKSLPSGRNEPRKDFEYSFNPAYRHVKSTDSLFEVMLKSNPKIDPSFVFIEVGCFRLSQSLYAAKLGYKVLAFEASPTNYKAMVSEREQLSEELKGLITIHNKAVSDVSGETLTFDAIGGTGDHVSGMNLDFAQKTKYDARPNSKVEVKTMSLDNVISQLPSSESVFFLKIDVQGHEAHVFKGLQKSIQQKKIRYILFEYWINALDDAAGKSIGSCSGVNDILIPLVDNGYTLFDLRVSHHPKAKTTGLRVEQYFTYFRPMDFFENCKWYVEKGRETPGYDMGYWTDVLAVHSGEF